MNPKLLKVAKLAGGKYALQFQFRPPMEDMFETATHAARFASMANAMEFRSMVLRRVPQRKEGRDRMAFDPLWWMNKAEWQGPTSPAASIRWDAKTSPYDAPTKALVA